MKPSFMCRHFAAFFTSSCGNIFSEMRNRPLPSPTNTVSISHYITVFLSQSAIIVFLSDVSNSWCNFSFLESDNAPCGGTDGGHRLLLELVFLRFETVVLLHVFRSWQRNIGQRWGDTRLVVYNWPPVGR